MSQSNDEYPFWARWSKRINNLIVPITDITNVNYEIQVYNITTNIFDNVTNGIIVASDSTNKWIVPFNIPSSLLDKKYICIFTPIGGNHEVLIDEINTFDGIIQSINNELIGCGTEIHSGKVCDRDGNPISNAAVVATPLGTSVPFSTATTDINGNYSLNGLYINHAYSISVNKNGFWSKVTETVIA